MPIRFPARAIEELNLVSIRTRECPTYGLSRRSSAGTEQKGTRVVFRQDGSDGAKNATGQTTKKERVERVSKATAKQSR